jgi:hypothetical protein
MASCAQNTSRTPARRTTVPKIACDQGAWQIAASKRCVASNDCSARLEA